MQRERCISRLAPDHYKHSPFGKKHKMSKLVEETDNANKKTIEFSNGLEITPLDLSNDKKKKPNGKEYEVQSSSDEDSLSNDYAPIEKDQPLDLSHSKEATERPLSPSVIEIDKTKLYEIAEKIGVSKERIDKEMAQKYEQLVRQNLRKQQKNLLKNRKRKSIDDAITNYHQTEIENRSPTLKAITEQVVGLEEDLTILPIQTLNNGDLTITPVLGPVGKPVENRDIMRVNSFFQNQLWKPEYIGLSSWRKLRNQSFDI